MFLFLILELKNTLGPAGDALLRAALDYTKIASQKMVQYSPLRMPWPTFVYSTSVSGRTVISCVLVSATANRLEISAAICLGLIYGSKLLTLELSYLQ